MEPQNKLDTNLNKGKRSARSMIRIASMILSSLTHYEEKCNAPKLFTIFLVYIVKNWDICYDCVCVLNYLKLVFYILSCCSSCMMIIYRPENLKTLSLKIQKIRPANKNELESPSAFTHFLCATNHPLKISSLFFKKTRLGLRICKLRFKSTVSFMYGTGPIMKNRTTSIARTVYQMLVASLIVLSMA